MTRAEAQEILLLYRPDMDEAVDPQMAAALDLARRDPELGRWFDEHCAFQKAMREKFQQIEVPTDLKRRLLAQMNSEDKIIRPAIWWRQPAWLAAAAAVILVIGIVAMWSRPSSSDGFANYESRMVSGALRQYQMDIRTNNLEAVRHTLEALGAPGGYSIPKGLQRLSLTGGGALRWQDNPVAMVCFDRGDKQMLFLFVMNRAAIKDPPSETPTTGVVRGLFTASWSEGDKVYLLAGPQEADFMAKYL